MCCIHFRWRERESEAKTEQEDLELEKELLADEKERAEHNMLVDLGRNDIGKISDFGTVEVEKYMSVERFSHVMHIGSTVKGQIRSTRQHWMPLMRFFRQEYCPGHRSFGPVRLLMSWKIISVVFTGAIGYLDFTGNLDTCIAIRLAFQRKTAKVFVRSGAIIVADSVPE